MGRVGGRAAHAAHSHGLACWAAAKSALACWRSSSRRYAQTLPDALCSAVVCCAVLCCAVLDKHGTITAHRPAAYPIRFTLTPPAGLLAVLESDRELNGKWYAFDGKEVPW